MSALMPVDGVEGGLGVEAGKHDDVTPGQPGRAGPHDGTVVVQRCRDDHAAVGPAEERRCVLVVERRVARDDELRPARRATGGRCLPRRGGDIGQRIVGQERVGPVAGGQRSAAAGELGGTPITQRGIRQIEDRLQLRPGQRWPRPVGGWRRSSSSPRRQRTTRPN